MPKIRSFDEPDFQVFGSFGVDSSCFVLKNHCVGNLPGRGSMINLFLTLQPPRQRPRSSHNLRSSFSLSSLISSHLSFHWTRWPSLSSMAVFIIIISLRVAHGQPFPSLSTELSKNFQTRISRTLWPPFTCSRRLSGVFPDGGPQTSSL